MFDIGFFELVLVAVVALLVVGPERLPGLVRSTGYWMGRIRHFISSANEEIQREIHNAEILRREAEEKARQALLEQAPGKQDDAPAAVPPDDNTKPPQT